MNNGPPPLPPFPDEFEPVSRDPVSRPWKDGSHSLSILLHGIFGHLYFRPHQEEVCQAVMAGDDALVVMPTGAGKSLCYQLPGLAHGGSALVISPLIALMEDQVAALQRLEIAADRLHSGRDRESSFQAAHAWRKGDLDFLFIAPERLGLTSFQDLIQEHPPRLVAIDEAHCISHWGHDFRPDYRLVGERLPRIQGVPLVALTATATPRVQNDIIEKLGINDARRFIRGFRRTNLAVECVEAPPSARAEMVKKVVTNPAARPALIYAPTRKETESLAAELADIAPSAAYHAGLPSSTRDRVQAEFLAGKLEIVVATIAFGMGIDKADIRTVFHTALPGTIEAYYQEIGRAGRDGDNSRVILLWSWADRRTHEYFHTRDYPEPSVLERVFEVLSSNPISKDDLQKKVDLDPEILVAALNQLWIHQGAQVDPEVNALRGSDEWRKTYRAQRDHRLAQLEEISRYAGGRSCRMTAIVEHFGDRLDSGVDCNLCDHCVPKDCLLRSYRPPTVDECRVLIATVDALHKHSNRTRLQLFKQAAEPEEMVRKDFERLLDALARENLVEVWSDSFTKDGREIHFQRAALTPEARRQRAFDPSMIELTAEVASKAGTRKKRKAAKKAILVSTVLSSDEETLLKTLRTWRLSEARRRRIPAFRILGDRTLEALVRARPSDNDELLDIPGIGPTIARKYGKKLLEMLVGN